MIGKTGSSLWLLGLGALGATGCAAIGGDTDSRDSDDVDTAGDSGTTDSDTGATDTGPVTLPGTPIAFSTLGGGDYWGAQQAYSCDTIYAELLRSNTEIDIWAEGHGIPASLLTDLAVPVVDWSIQTVMPYYIDCNSVGHTITLDAVQLLDPTRIGVWGTITHPFDQGAVEARIWGLAVLDLTCPDCTIDPADITETEIQLD